MGDGDAESLTSSPGARLQVARVQAGLSVSQAAERLHVDRQTLDALESGHLEGLGASVFVRGHLRRYAELLGIPEAEILASYEAWSGRLAAQPDLRDVITGPGVRSGTRGFEVRPRQALIGAIVVVLIGLIWWAMHKAPRLTSMVAAPTVPGVAAVPVQAPSPPPAPAPAAAAAPVAHATRQSAAVAAAAVSEPVSTPVSSAPMRLGLSFSADSWAEIYGADGAQLFHGLAQAGSRHHVSGSAPLRLFFGNPASVELEMNGRPLAWNSASGAAKPRRFSLDGGGRVVEAPASQP